MISIKLGRRLVNLEGLDINKNHDTNDVKEIDFALVFVESMVFFRSISFEAKPET